MSDPVLDRLAELETAVRRAGETLARLREENERLRREIARLAEERKQVLVQVDGILKDLARLDLGAPQS